MPPLPRTTRAVAAAGNPLRIPGRWQSDEPIARDYNALRDAVAALAAARGEGGIVVTINQSGVVYRYVAAGEEMLSVIVAATVRGTRYTTPGEQPPPAYGSEIRYDVSVIGRPEFGTADGPGQDRALRGMEAELGRPVKDDEVELWPCRVGDPCWVVRLPGGPGADGVARLVLRVDSEASAWAPCAGEGGGGTP